MSLSAAALRKMREMGLSADQMIEPAEVIEASRPASAGAERTRRWRERKAESRAKALTASPGDVTDATSPPPPAPLKQINPSPRALADARGPAAAGARASSDAFDKLSRLQRLKPLAHLLQPLNRSYAA